MRQIVLQQLAYMRHISTMSEPTDMTGRRFNHVKGHGATDPDAARLSQDFDSSADLHDRWGVMQASSGGC